MKKLVTVILVCFLVLIAVPSFAQQSRTSKHDPACACIQPNGKITGLSSPFVELSSTPGYDGGIYSVRTRLNILDMGIVGQFADAYLGHSTYGAGYIATWGAYPLMFGTNRGMRMMIDKDGNVGINPWTDTWAKPPLTSKLTVKGLKEYYDNEDAIYNGLTEGALYRTGDVLKVVH